MFGISGSTGGTNTGTQLDMAKLQEMLKQIQQASSGTSWNSGISGTQLDTQKLNAFLKQLQAATNGTSWSSGSGWSTSGNWSSSIPTDMFITSGGKAAQISGMSLVKINKYFDHKIANIFLSIKFYICLVGILTFINRMSFMLS